VIACDRPLLWIGLTQTSFMGPVVVHYTFEAMDGGTRFTRILRNPARPKPPSAEMIERMSAEAELGLGNIKKIVERR
jgi:hypothetical protein